MPKNDFESTNFAKFEEVVHNFGRSDDDRFSEKMLFSNKCVPENCLTVCVQLPDNLEKSSDSKATAAILG